MSGDNRLKKLRDLVAQLERLPDSAERERMLREVRGRIVDLDTGVAPRPMRPVEDESAADVRRPRALPLPEPVRPVQVPPDVPASVPRADVEDESSSIGIVDLLALGVDDLLSLDDPAPSGPERDGGPAAPPWTRGLRG